MLKRVQEVRAALAKGGQNGFPPALLLSFDAVNAHGRAVVSYGDPDRAHNITTYVPGFTTQVEVGSADFDRALFTWSAANRLADGGRTASIAWPGRAARGRRTLRCRRCRSRPGTRRWPLRVSVPAAARRSGGPLP
ncbi:alpha/beta hydrolase [Streptosporangium sp. NPDC002544]|uniref:alpha/beta hydrolase n=1 Tax=Streptosporangium sp. NPDC002544 TaxID=3154538 RepID=UPI0033217948